MDPGLSICYADQKLEDLPIEPRLLDEVVVRLLEDGARAAPAR